LLDLLVETTLHGQAVQMMSYLEIDPDRDETQWNSLTDNRDFKTMTSWEPPDRQVTDETISDNFILEQRGIKLRQLILRCLATAVYLSEDIFPSREVSNGGAPGFHLSASMARLTEQLGQHWRDCQAAFHDWSPPPNTPQQPNPPKVISYCRTRQLNVLLDLLELVLLVNNINKGVGEKTDLEKEATKVMESAASHLQFTLDIVENDIKSGKSDSNCELINRFRHLESIIWTLESASFAAILCGVTQCIIRPAGATKGKKGKKKGAREVQPKFSCLVDRYNDMLAELEKGLNKLGQLVKDFEDAVSLDEMVVVQSQFSAMNMDSEQEEEVTQRRIGKNLSESYRISFLQIKTILENKLNYVSFLKL